MGFEVPLLGFTSWTFLERSAFGGKRELSGASERLTGPVRGWKAHWQSIKLEAGSWVVLQLPVVLRGWESEGGSVWQKACRSKRPFRQSGDQASSPQNSRSCDGEGVQEADGTVRSTQLLSVPEVLFLTDNQKTWLPAKHPWLEYQNNEGATVCVFLCTWGMKELMWGPSYIVLGSGSQRPPSPCPSISWAPSGSFPFYSSSFPLHSRNYRQLGVYRLAFERAPVLCQYFLSSRAHLLFEFPEGVHTLIVAPSVLKSGLQTWRS